jgi:hypothetical protein
MKSGQNLRPRGFLRRELATQPTKQGDRFWRLGGPQVEPENGLPIWASEVTWLIAVLEDIADTLALDCFAPEEQQYPLAFRPTGTHAVALLLQRHRGGSELWIERWSGVHQNALATQGVMFSAYWYCDKPYRSFSRLILPLKSDWAEALRNFVREWRQDLEQDKVLVWARLVGIGDHLPQEAPPVSQIVVTIPTSAGDRHISFYPFCPPPTEARVLDKPLRRVLLETCSEPRTARQVAQRVVVVDATTVRNDLVWTARYDDETLREAAFLTPVQSKQVDYLVATLRLPSFLADPLLTALAPVRSEGKPYGEAGPSPQRPEGLPLSKLRGQKMIDSQVLSTALGDYPLPTPAEVKNTRAAAMASPRLRREWRRVLQWLDLESRCQVNLATRDRLRRVLGWQKLALLRFDCIQFLANDVGNPAVLSVIREAATRHALSLAGTMQPAPLLRSQNLPR